MFLRDLKFLLRCVLLIRGCFSASPALPIFLLPQGAPSSSEPTSLTTFLSQLMFLLLPEKASVVCSMQGSAIHLLIHEYLHNQKLQTDLIVSDQCNIIAMRESYHNRMIRNPLELQICRDCASRLPSSKCSNLVTDLSVSTDVQNVLPCSRRLCPVTLPMCHSWQDFNLCMSPRKITECCTTA